MTDGLRVSVHTQQVDGEALVAVVARVLGEEGEPAPSLTLSLTSADARKIADQIVVAAVIAESERFFLAFLIGPCALGEDKARQAMIAYRIELERRGVTDGAIGSGELAAGA